MTLRLDLDHTGKRIAWLLMGIALCTVLASAALLNLIVGLLTDQRANVSRELLAAAIWYAPDSATLNARLAEAELAEEDRDTATIETRATRAANLSPWDYRHRLLLATVAEARGDRAAAEQSLREALELAPGYTEVRWRLANVLLRQGKLARSVPEFRAAAATKPSLLPSTLDLLWRVSAANLNVVEAATPTDPKSRLTLASFLLKQKRAPDAITLFSGIGRESLNALPQSSVFINSLISEGLMDEARGLWIGLVSGMYGQPGRPLPLIWNGSFESDALDRLPQFDWAVGRNQYAISSVDSTAAHSGTRSLRVDFTGRDTARLDGQVKQLVVLRPGARYRLQFYVKTDRLESPEGPRVVVSDASSSEIGGSSPIPSGSSDWRLIAFEFTAPATARAVSVAIKRVPKFSYDDPTAGSIWFDDFELTELSK